MGAVAAHKAAWAAHRAKMSGKQGSAAAAAPAASGDYAVWQAACKHDWDALKTIADHAVRNQRKPALLDKYRDYLTRWAYDNRAAPHQNDVLVRNLVWACDAGQWVYARNLADDCAATHQANTLMERTPCTFFVDSAVQAAEKGNRHPDLTGVLRSLPGRIATAGGWSVNDFAAAKLHRALAKHDKQTAPEVALHHAQEAHRLDPNVGVKGLIAELARVTAPLTQAGGEDAAAGVVSLPADAAPTPAAPVLPHPDTAAG